MFYSTTRNITTLFQFLNIRKTFLKTLLVTISKTRRFSLIARSCFRTFQSLLKIFRIAKFTFRVWLTKNKKLIQKLVDWSTSASANSARMTWVFWRKWWIKTSVTLWWRIVLANYRWHKFTWLKRSTVSLLSLSTPTSFIKTNVSKTNKTTNRQLRQSQRKSEVNQGSQLSDP